MSQLRYEDNFDHSNAMGVYVGPAASSLSSVAPDAEAFLKKYSFLLGEQTFDGDTISEGGFAQGRVAAASVLEIGTGVDARGNPAYRAHVLTRTADGDEGGKHHLILATVASGKTWIFDAQIGDKRWFKGVQQDAEGAWNSFSAL